jgi:predicted ATPase
MRLLRVQVPEFRALKDVDITFEKDFVPAVFPIGSQNGGGKSTLLQFIFILLHCPFNSNREHLLKNVLHGLKSDEHPKKLAQIHIFDTEIHNIEFFIAKDEIQDKSILKNFRNNSSESMIDKYRFSSVDRVAKLHEDISIKRKILDILSKILTNLKELKDFGYRSEYLYLSAEIHNELESLIKNKLLLNEYIFQSILDTEEWGAKDFSFIENQVKKEIIQLDIELTQICKEEIQLSEPSEYVANYLEEQDFNFICAYSSSKESEFEDSVLLCKHQSQHNETEQFFKRVSEKIFLSSPLMQVFIFTPRESQKLLFKGANRQGGYYSLIKSIEIKLPGLFTYDLLSVDLLIDSFKKARDQDFKTAVKSGKYGQSYQELINDLNHILVNKKINVSPELSEITFKLLSDSGNEIDLYPENLSHGELKRLSLYMWIKSRLIEDSIVLMDEVEIAFHPDWQYQIVSDLAHWAPSNQYILATHSYELCQAVTPAHVKELEPKLLKAES